MKHTVLFGTNAEQSHPLGRPNSETRRTSAKKVHTVVCSSLMCLIMPLGSAALDDSTHNLERRHHHHYSVVDLGTLGGTNSGIAEPPARTLTNRGTVLGISDTTTPDPLAPNCLNDSCTALRSFLWHNNRTTELPSLASQASNAALWENDRGWEAGISETGSLDIALGTPQYAAVLWRDGVVKELGTLGGASSVANAINNHGQVVGGASNGVPDSFSMLSSDFYVFGPFPANTQSHAFAWTDGSIVDLGTLGGTDSMAILNNDRGQVVGISYLDDVPSPDSGFPAIGTFVWQQGKMQNIGGFGGNFTQPLALNRWGEIVGWSLLKGDQILRSFIWRNGSLKDMGSLGGENVYVHSINDQGLATGYSDIPPGTSVFGHPFVWKNGHMTDLGAPPRDSDCATGQAINSKEQVVGRYGCSAQRSNGPFLAEYGLPAVDLNDLVIPGTRLSIQNVFSINEQGEIACVGVLPNGNQRACLMEPLDDYHDWYDDATDGVRSALITAPASVSAGVVSHNRGMDKTYIKPRAHGMDRSYLPPKGRGLPLK